MTKLTLTSPAPALLLLGIESEITRSKFYRKETQVLRDGSRGVGPTNGAKYDAYVETREVSYSRKNSHVDQLVNDGQESLDSRRMAGWGQGPIVVTISPTPKARHDANVQYKPYSGVAPSSVDIRRPAGLSDHLS
ncbi:hypothetical protein BJY52DRAFT_1422684 [Lactarius psammicola]|nr:hypothetical protein BJY52DRAFT_1422684 [Lactarius psammicola]